jgi:hypothetical protein
LVFSGWFETADQDEMQTYPVGESLVYQSWQSNPNIDPA